MGRIQLIQPSYPDRYADKTDPLPQCEHLVTTYERTGRLGTWRESRYGERGTEVMCCQRRASLILDGRYYCRPHAGRVLLQELIDRELADGKQRA